MWRWMSRHRSIRTMAWLSWHSLFYMWDNRINISRFSRKLLHTVMCDSYTIVMPTVMSKCLSNITFCVHLHCTALNRAETQLRHITYYTHEACALEPIIIIIIIILMHVLNVFFTANIPFHFNRQSHRTRDPNNFLKNGWLLAQLLFVAFRSSSALLFSNINSNIIFENLFSVWRVCWRHSNQTYSQFSPNISN